MRKPLHFAMEFYFMYFPFLHSLIFILIWHQVSSICRTAFSIFYVRDKDKRQVEFHFECLRNCRLHVFYNIEILSLKVIPLYVFSYEGATDNDRPYQLKWLRSHYVIK